MRLGQSKLIAVVVSVGQVLVQSRLYCTVKWFYYLQDVSQRFSPFCRWLNVHIAYQRGTKLHIGLGDVSGMEGHLL